MADRRRLILDLPLAIAMGSLCPPVPTDTGAHCAWAADVSPQSSDDSFIRVPRSPSDTARLPRIGYSMYKTVREQVGEGVSLALLAGVRHFDCATQYSTNAEVGRVLQRYIQSGTIETRDGTVKTSKQSQEKRRNELYLTHKVSNAEQSLSREELQRNVLLQGSVLLGNTKSKSRPPLDLVMLHSPLTDRNRRLSSYASLCDLVDQQKIGAVGVCHFGVKPLQ